MANTDCGWCGRLVYLDAVSGLLTVPAGTDGLRVVEAAYKCPNCHRLVTVSEYTGRPESSYDRKQAQDYTWGEGAEFVPHHRESEEFPDVPEHIATAATEATLCLSVGAFRAVGALTRAVVEATAKDKSAEGKDLYQRINALADGGHIRKHTKEQAHEVRHFGNGMAHGDFADPTTRAEAQEAIALMAEVLDEVYQSPARLEKVKQARIAKSAQ